MTREFKNNLYYEINRIVGDRLLLFTLAGAVRSEDVVVRNEGDVFGIIRYEDNETLTAEQIEVVKTERDALLTDYREVFISELTPASGGSLEVLHPGADNTFTANPVSTVMIDDPDSTSIPPAQIPAPLGLRLVLYSTILERDLEINRGVIDKNIVPRLNEFFNLGDADNRLNRVHTKDIYLSSGMIQQPGGVEIELPMKSGALALEDDTELNAFIQPLASDEIGSRILGDDLGDLAYISQVGNVDDGTKTIIFTPLGSVINRIFEENQAGSYTTKTVKFPNESGNDEVLGTFDDVLIEGQEGGYLMTISAEAGVTIEDWENALKRMPEVAVAPGHTAFYARSGYFNDLTTTRFEAERIQAKEYNMFNFSDANPTNEDLEGKPEGFRWLTINDEFVKVGNSWLNYANRSGLFDSVDFTLADALVLGTLYELKSIGGEQFSWTDFSSTSLFGDRSVNEVTVNVASRRVQIRGEVLAHTRQVGSPKDGRFEMVPYSPAVFSTIIATATFTKVGDSGFRITAVNANGLETGTIPTITGTPV